MKGCVAVVTRAAPSACGGARGAPRSSSRRPEACYASEQRPSSDRAATGRRTGSANLRRLPMKFLCSTLTAATLLACASGGSNTVNRETPASVEGTYDFVASTPGQPVRGTLQVTADTMFFGAVEGCDSNIRSEPIGNASHAGVFRYACNSAVLEFDRRNLVRFSKWSATVQQQRLRQVCAQRAVQNGREVCVRTEMERYEVPESRSGTIQVTRRP